MAKDPVREMLEVECGWLVDQLRHVDIEDACGRLGMPTPSPGEGHSKTERLLAALEATPDSALRHVAEQYLRSFPPRASNRNRIEDHLWATIPGPSFSKRARRNVAQALAVEDLFGRSDRFMELLQRLWVLDGGLGLWALDVGGLEQEIEQHVFRNPGDWKVDYLFERLGAYDCPDRRFVLFIEGMASPDVQDDEPRQRDFVDKVNRALAPARAELRETGTAGGYPIFTLASTGAGHVGRPKNLIFASSCKPDLRFRDAVDNDIEIVTNADQVLVYDRSIGEGGLLWRDLQAWWAATRNLDDGEEAKRSFYRRLLSSLPESSPAQRLLFESFYRTFGARVPDLPALLPEVWLHWDPKSARQRGAAALARFRMDFLLLAPANQRIVIEVDGKHHYADDDDRASPTRYGAMMAADRDLKVAGYEVYRFGAAELDSNAGQRLVSEFFTALFHKHGLLP